jgi:hypothetical protein
MPKNTAAPVTVEIATPKRRGRPSNFPDQETIAFLAHIPIESRDMVREVAEKRGEPIAVTLNRMIERSFKEATRSKGKAKKAAPAPEVTESN